MQTCNPGDFQINNLKCAVCPKDYPNYANGTCYSCLGGIIKDNKCLLIRPSIPRSDTDTPCPKYYQSYQGYCYASCPDNFSKDPSNITQCIANDNKGVPPKNIYHINLPSNSKIMIKENMERFKNIENEDCDYSTDYIIFGCIVISLILFYYLRR
jgi:hypothetical protein